jgi:diguanylate cyclase (GGDEF)-like protein/PAS domain S-box-containing protein
VWDQLRIAQVRAGTHRSAVSALDPSIPLPAAARVERLGPRLRRFPVPVLLVALAATPILVALAAADAFGRALIWERVHLTVAAVVALALAGPSLRGATGRVRDVRAWIAFACVAWLASEILRDAHAARIAIPFPPDLVLIAVVVAAAGAYRSALKGHFSRIEEYSVYLDAAIVSAAVAAALLVVAGRVASIPSDLSPFLFALVFLTVLAATVILDLATLPPLRARGAYAVLGGLALLTVGYIGRSGLADPAGAWAFAGLVSAGVIAVGYGTATWTDARDPNPTYARLAARARDVIPIAAVALVPLLLIPAETLSEQLPIRLAIDACVAVVVVAAILRQSLLLRQRGEVLRGLRNALGAAERRARQVTGLEEAGRLLAPAGATPSALDRVARLLSERFGYAHVAIYLGDEKHLQPTAQHGRLELLPGLDASRGVVGRVVRTREPAFVPDVSRDPDYVAGHAGVRGEICVPLLDGDSLLGVLDVQSTRSDVLDESDAAGALAVADRVASALALERERAHLVAEKDFVSAIVESVGAMVIVVDGDGQLVRFNAACSDVSGYTRAELEALGTMDFLVPPEDLEGVRETIAGLIPGQEVRLENDWIRRDGSRRHIAWSNTAVADDFGNVRYSIATGVDITDRKRLEKELAHQALHDHLTGLPNRRLLRDRLEQALRARSPGTVALLFLDLDDFKAVNDSLAHAAGDQVLVEVAERLRGCLRADDTVARVGGDEFAILVPSLAVDAEAQELADRVAAVLSAPFRVERREVAIQASIGIATTSDGALDADLLLGNADVAMYWAKRQGRARSAFFRPEMHAAVRERRDLEAALRDALERDEFLLDFQPILDLGTRRLVGAEALLRWRRPGYGLLAPAEFLSAAEQTGLIVPVGSWVIDEACRQLRVWRDVLGAEAPDWVSVNVSARQFQDVTLLDHVQQAIERSSLAASDLVLEVTESLVMEDAEMTIRRLEALRALGVTLAIDDFGTGYSALSYLDRLPVHIVKIDQSFVAEGLDPKRGAFIRTIVSLCESLGLRTIAEGVETEAQAAELERVGCGLGQGYWFARPLAAGAFSRWVAARTRLDGMPAGASAPAELGHRATS